MNKFSIIIVHFSSIQDTKSCLQSLYDLSYKEFDIVIVDNSTSINNTFPVKEILTEDFIVLEENRKWSINEYSTITYIRTINKGFSHANNIGITYAFQNLSFDWIWLLNNDTEVESQSLSVIDSYVNNTNKKIGIVGHDIFYLSDKTKLQGIGGTFSFKLFLGNNLVPKSYNKETCNECFNQSAAYILGASMFVKKEFIEDVGLMDEDYFLYYEEIDWAWRGKLKNWQIGYCHSAKIFHKEGASIGSSYSLSTKSGLATYHGIRSKMLFIKKHFPHKKNVRIFLVLISIANRIIKGKFKDAIDVFNIYKKYW